MNGDDTNGNREQWGGRTWTLIAALIVVALIIGAGVWVLALRDDDDTAPTPQPSAPTATVTELPEDFVGGRDVIDGVPVGFSHDQAGAISAAVTWTGMAFVYPRTQRAPGITNVFTDTAPPIDPEGQVDAERVIAATPLAVRGTVDMDTGVVEVLSTVTGDFVNGLPPESDQLAVNLEIISVTLVWDAAAEDWRISAWSRRELAPGEMTPGNLAGFQYVRAIGSTLTELPIGALGS